MPAIDRSECTARYHGDYSAYQHAKCRCPDARDDWRLYYKRLREGRAPARRIDPTGPTRRIQALWAIGHTSETIGAAADGMSPHHIQQTTRRKWIRPETAEAIRAAYEALSGTPGTSDTTRRRAHALDYAPPLAWWGRDIDDPQAQPHLGGDGDDIVDEVAIRRALAGQMPFSQLRPPERVEVYRQLVAEGAGSAVIRRRLNINGFTLARLVALAEAATGGGEQVAA